MPHSKLPSPSFTALRVLPLIALIVAFTFSTSEASAEEFLTCNASTVRKPSAAETQLKLAPRELTAQVKGIMHDFAGDDISAYFGVTPAIMITGDASPNAYVTQVNEIVLSRGLLGMLSSNSELAFVVAHELGHIMLGHNSPQNGRDARFAFTGNAGHVKDQIQREIEADRFALKLLNSSGFDVQSSVTLLARLSRSGKDRGAALGESYPSLGARLAALQNQIFAEHCGTF